MFKTYTTCRCVYYDKMLGYLTLKAIHNKKQLF